jgi:hypothetical protein
MHRQRQRHHRRRQRQHQGDEPEHAADATTEPRLPADDENPRGREGGGGVTAAGTSARGGSGGGVGAPRGRDSGVRRGSGVAGSAPGSLEAPPPVLRRGRSRRRGARRGARPPGTGSRIRSAIAAVVSAGIAIRARYAQACAPASNQASWTYPRSAHPQAHRSLRPPPRPRPAPAAAP